MCLAFLFGSVKARQSVKLLINDIFFLLENIGRDMIVCSWWSLLKNKKKKKKKKKKKVNCKLYLEVFGFFTLKF